jgi:hypothetical protein
VSRAARQPPWPNVKRRPPPPARHSDELGFRQLPADHLHIHEGLEEEVERLEALRAGEHRVNKTAAQALGVE